MPEKGMHVDFSIESTIGQAIDVYLVQRDEPSFLSKHHAVEENYNLIDWTKKCFQNYTNFRGRARRKEFWLFYLTIMIVSICTQTIDAKVDSNGLFNILWNIMTLIPLLSAGARRLHDTGRSGWWQLLILTFIGIIPLIIFLASETKPENNKWGVPAK
ncbi:DUF805 domain-containing protein [Acinetobacter baretiae]|uniref:DUF805 domain-containing protein n=1 Tax=Acinetobacter baretiae TaxID=2605383 RepID=UPI0039A6EF05